MSSEVNPFFWEDFSQNADLFVMCRRLRLAASSSGCSVMSFSPTDAAAAVVGSILWCATSGRPQPVKADGLADVLVYWAAAISLRAASVPVQTSGITNTSLSPGWVPGSMRTRVKQALALSVNWLENIDVDVSLVWNKVDVDVTHALLANSLPGEEFDSVGLNNDAVFVKAQLVNYAQDSIC